MLWVMASHSAMLAENGQKKQKWNLKRIDITENNNRMK